MTHIMIPAGLDHAYETCPAFKADRRKFPTWPVFINLDHHWKADYENDPKKGNPFGLCGWCWRVYRARNHR